MTSNYFPSTLNARGPAPWTGSVPHPEHRPRAGFGPVSSGSSRNFHRGWGGDKEVGAQTLNRAGNFAARTAGRYLFYKNILGETNSDLEQLHQDLQGGPGRLGAPKTGDSSVGPSREPLALGPAPRQQPERVERPMLGAGPASGYAPKMTTNSQLELNAGPRVFKMGAAPGIDNRALGTVFPSLVAGPNLSSPTAGDNAPSATAAGRRSDPGRRKRAGGDIRLNNIIGKYDT